MKTQLTLLLFSSLITFVSCGGDGSSPGPSPIDSGTVDSGTVDTGPADNGSDDPVTIDPGSGDHGNGDGTASIDSTEALIDYYGGTIVKASWVPGFAGNALQFNGRNSYVILPDHPDLHLAEEGTMGAFIYVNSHKENAGIIHRGENPDYSDEDFSFGFSGKEGKLLVSLVNEQGERQTLLGQGTIETGVWYHVAATWDSKNVTLYINGSVDASAANTIGTVRQGTGSLIIGAQLPVKYSNKLGNLGMNGLIDEVMIAPEAMTAAMIGDYYREMTQQN